MTDEELPEEVPDAVAPVKPPIEPRTPFGGRMNMVGVPLERSENFRNSTLRLAGRLRNEGLRLGGVFMLAVISVVLVVLGPRVLGAATNTIVAGLQSPQGIDYGKLHRTLLLALGLYGMSAVLAYLQAYVLAGVVQRTMFRLRSEVEEKLNRLPLSDVDRRPRGDLLSRVTNDIDNVAQSL
ncbi:MAG: ABC transporter transmembrane domain-containing protein, partial [Acidimicrobiia bacterium]